MKSVIAVDLGATHVRVARVLHDGTFCTMRKERVADLNGETVTSRIASMIADAMDGEVSAIGISTAGPVDLNRGCVVNSPNMHAEEIHLTEPLSDEFRMPVKMLTDCKAGVLGEHMFGAGKDCENLAYITISSGIGCGILQNGIVLSGADGNAGEAGHFIVDTCYDVPCGCGGTGHWESCCSGSGIPRFFKLWCRKHHPELHEEKTAEDILSYASRGAEPYASFGAILTAYNARGIQSVICAYNPARIVLDGPVALNHHWLFSGTVEPYLRRPEIVFSTLEGNAPLLGAAAYAFRE